jgi:hypothetical protein
MSSGTQLSYSHGTSSTALLGETIGENLKRVAAEHGESEILVDVPTGRRWTYRRFDTDTDDLARAELRRLGAAAVRHRQDRRDPGQHQPGLPQP